MGLVAQAALVLALGCGSSGWYQGYAVRYAPGKFEEVENNRGLTHVARNMASPRHPIGSWVWVEGLNTGVRLRIRVADTSKPEHKAGHIARGIFEVDPESGALLCGDWWEGNAKECPIIVSP